MSDHVGKEAVAEIVELRSRIADLEVGIRRAIHLVEMIRPFVMWPIDNPDELYNDEWARLSLDMVREALAKPTR